ncbi:hypothetical protein Dimus_028191 [Dionaea muscipula]
MDHQQPAAAAEYMNWSWKKRRASMVVKGCRTTSDDESWEERAFAEDVARLLGGCEWPSRSYTCSFCRREFKSAQALGGHMNVHRRDKASRALKHHRIKQLQHDDHLDHEHDDDHAHDHAEYDYSDIIIRPYHHNNPRRSISPPLDGIGNNNSTSTDEEESLQLSHHHKCCSNKRRKSTTTAVAINNEVLGPSSGQLETNIGLNRPCSSSSPLALDELDLELRLGYRPKFQ